MLHNVQVDTDSHHTLHSLSRLPSTEIHEIPIDASEPVDFHAARPTHCSVTHMLPTPAAGFHSSHRQQHPPSSICLPKPHLSSSHQHTAGRSLGLRTPPVDDMSTTYHAPLASYDSHAMHAYPQQLSQPARAKMPMANDQANAQVYRPPVQVVQQQPHQHMAQQPQSQPSQQYAAQWWPAKSAVPAVPAPLPSNTTTQPHRRPTSPPAPTTTFAPAQAAQQSSQDKMETLIYHSLVIPKRISPNGGNLSDFSAQVREIEWHWQIGRELTHC